MVESGCFNVRTQLGHVPWWMLVSLASPHVIWFSLEWAALRRADRPALGRIWAVLGLLGAAGMVIAESPESAPNRA